MLRLVPPPFSYLLSLVACLCLWGASLQHVRTQPCQGVSIQVQQRPNNYFLEVKGVKKLLRIEDNILGVPVGDLSLTAVEHKLRITGYVAHVQAYYTAQHQLMLQLRLRTPIARVIDRNGHTFYTDLDGHKMPPSPQFAAKVLLVRGAFHEAESTTDTLQDSTLKSLLPLLSYIYNNDFFRAQLSEVVMNPFGELTLYPAVGNLPIHFGKVYEYDKKLPLLLTFYKQVLNRVGWDHYTAVSLQYTGQVVASRRLPSSAVASNPSANPSKKPSLVTISHAK